MSQTNAHSNTALTGQLERATLEGRNKILGFWLFLGAETVLFGTLFAAYLGLRHQVLDGPTPQELFSLPFVALMTAVLLVSSLTSVLAVQAMHRGNVKVMQRWLIVTVLLGFTFLCLEIYEFNHYVALGHTFSTSAFSSSFYSLVGFHGAHVVIGVVWITLVILQMPRKGLTPVTANKVYVASLYWHYIDVIWVFIFSLVYLLGRVG